MTTDSPFSPSALSKHVETALATIPKGAKGAVIAYAKLDGSVGISVATRLGDQWSAGANFQRDSSAGTIAGSVVVQRTW